MKAKAVVSMLALAAVCCGCATIISGTTQVLTFQSAPPGADVIVNGAAVGITPLKVRVKRKQGTRILVRKDGYREETLVLKQKLEPWFWGNVIFAGVFGSTTDLATGATIEYTPGQYFTTLEAVTSAPASQSMGVSDSQRSKVMRFVLVNYDVITKELNAGSGEYLKALFDLLGVSKTERPVALLVIKRLFVEKPSIPDFAEGVAKAFGH